MKRILSLIVLAVCVGMLLSAQLAVADKLSQERADKVLAKYGIDRWSSNENDHSCYDRTKRNCTSLEGIHDFVLFEVVVLKQLSGCAITITGGTETGHKDIKYSHAKGYKIDLRFSSHWRQSPRTTCIIDFIRENADYMGETSQGWKQWRWVDSVYTQEPSHWDIVKTDWGAVDRSDYLPYYGSLTRLTLT